MLYTNKSVILWGSGNCGKYIFKTFNKKGINVIAFGDSNSDKIGQSILGIPIISKVDVAKNYMDAAIIITTQRENNEKIRDELRAANIHNDIYTLSEVLAAEGVGDRRRECAEFHLDHMDNYFKNAESQRSRDVFWSNSSPFKELFDMLDTRKIVELACGRGRHVQHYIDETEKIVLVDVLEKNISFCRERFKGYSHIQYYTNSGCDLKELLDDEFTAIFSYDAMVHFESIDIYYYLLETYRILGHGGMALYHHSNNHQDYRTSFMTGVNGRNYMSMDLFAHFADRAGLEVIDQKVIKWGDVEDGLTLLKKI